MADIFFLSDTVTFIDRDLVRATRSPREFADVHRQYWRRYGGDMGLTTYREAFDYLTKDLRDAGLPVRYASINSFEAARSREMGKKS